MPYRAPELFDVKTGSIVDKVDIWSTLYVCLVGKSLFEARSKETGGSLSMCVLGGDWRFHDEKSGTSKGRAKAGSHPPEGSTPSGDHLEGGAAISEPVMEVVRRCLRVELAERLDIHPGPDGCD